MANTTRTRRSRRPGGLTWLVLGWAWLASMLAVPAAHGDFFLNLSPVSTGTITQELTPPYGQSLGGEFLGTLITSAGTLQQATGYLKFDLSALPANAVILSSSLRLNIAGVQSTKPVSTKALTLSGFGSASGIVQLPDASSPRVGLGSTPNLPYETGPTDLDLPFTFSDTAFIQSLVDARTRYAGFSFDPSASTNISVWGLSSPDPSRVPLLTITFVPEPASLLTLALGLAILGPGWYLGRRARPDGRRRRPR